MESVDFLFHMANHDVVEKSSFVSDDIPTSEMKFEAGLLWDVKCISTVNEKLDSFLEEIFNKNMDETDIYVFPFDSEVESADTQISELVIWIDTIAFSSGGHV